MRIYRIRTLRQEQALQNSEKRRDSNNWSWRFQSMSTVPLSSNLHCVAKRFQRFENDFLSSNLFPHRKLFSRSQCTHGGQAGSAKLSEETITIEVSSFMQLIVPHHQTCATLLNESSVWKQLSILLSGHPLQNIFSGPSVTRIFWNTHIEVKVVSAKLCKITATIAVNSFIHTDSTFVVKLVLHC